MAPTLYQYRIDLVRVVDGDTVEATIRLGLNVQAIESIRLHGINCPEKHGASYAAGMAARAFTAEWLSPPGTLGTGFRSDLWLDSIKFDGFEKYGRVLGKIYRGEDPVSLNDALLAAGHAVPFMV